jgi:ribosome-associated protein
MEDIVSKNLARELALYIDDHKGVDTVALYIGEKSSFTDCFVITTASSEGHLKGLYNNILELLKAKKIDLLHRKKNMDNTGWVLIDCGNVIIHLMTQEKRSFYDLEKLWFEGETFFHSSSKSS